MQKQIIIVYYNINTIQRGKGLFILSIGRKGFIRRSAVILVFVLVFVSIITAGSVLINKKRDHRVIGGKELDMSVRDENDVLRLADFFAAEEKPSLISCEEVTIPKKFNGIYEYYNNLQEPLGTDLSDYKGRKCLKYCLQFAGNEETGKTMTLLVYDGRFIGGDISDDLFDGQMISLSENLHES